MSQVHAPYHFVPLSKWIYMPEWAHQVSHDVPFKDGYSGVLQYTLTNATPLLVGDKQTRQDGQAGTVTWARDPYGNPVIPGSSLKGMIRNVMEIATFGKFAQMDESHFSYRDISNSSTHYAKNVIGNARVYSAWVRYDESTKAWSLSRCNQAKVKHADIQKQLNKKIVNDSSAVDKYNTLPLHTEFDANIEMRKSKQGDVNWVISLGKGSVKGHFVFCNNRIKGQGKPEFYEFSYFFYGEPKPEKVNQKTLAELVNKMFASHNEDQIAYLQKHAHPTLGIPVFALFDTHSKKLKSLGLTKMPRVLYDDSAEALAEKYQTKARSSEHVFDMAELVMGTLRDEGLGLKSRVSFSDAQLSTGGQLFDSKPVTLNSPKATFVGNYVEQNAGAKQYNDYNQQTAKLAGWKRYIARPEFKENKPANDNTKVQTRLELMKAGSAFTGRIVFHNLTRIELGALIWSLHLGNAAQAGQHYHGLGHGKSLGAGAVQIRCALSRINGNNAAADSPTLEELIEHFVAHMSETYSAHGGLNWQDSPQIQHLFTIGNLTNNKDRNTDYMELSDFGKAKTAGSALPAMELGGEPLERKEPATLQSFTAQHFTKGRLAGLISEADKHDTWFANQMKEKERQAREAAFKQEEEAKQQAAEAQKTALESLPEDQKQVMALRLKLEQAPTPETKSEHNKDVESKLIEFTESPVSSEAAQAKYDLVKDKATCVYLAIKNPKKLKNRKALFKAFCEKYGFEP